jgi:hypothetical protein
MFTLHGTPAPGFAPEIDRSEAEQPELRLMPEWSLTTFVNSGLFPFVVYAGPLGDEKKMRRLRRQAKLSGTMVILVRDEPLPAWQAHYQYLSNGKRLHLLRGGQPS